MSSEGTTLASMLERSSRKHASRCITSYGISLMRRGPQGTEILFIKKRSTYAYITFVKGAYGRNNDGEITKLFNNMTMEEKICVMTMDFSKMWHMCYLSSPHRLSSKDLHKYETYKSKFEKRFLCDGGIRLKSLMSKTRNVDLIWEIPKGMASKGESHIQTAIREFQEETGICKSKYYILWNRSPMEYTFCDEGVCYRYVYYLGEMLDTRYVPSIDICSKPIHAVETSGIRFMRLDDIYWHFGSRSPFSQFCKKMVRAFKRDG